MCDVKTNTILLNEVTMESIRIKVLKVKFTIERRQNKYDKMDIKSYHDKMITKFKHIFTFKNLHKYKVIYLNNDLIPGKHIVF